MNIPSHLTGRVAILHTLSQWERAELGRDLRRHGLSYREIMHHIPVAKATVSRWCRDIELTEEQHRAIAERTGSQAGTPRDTQHRRRAEIARLRETARVEALDLASHPAWVAGLLLYWAEGSKTENRLALANSDPALIRMFLGWVGAYVMQQPRFSIRVVLHAGNDEPAAREYWIDQTGLDAHGFVASYIKPEGTGHRKNHLAHGVCQIRVRRSTDGLHRVMGWIEAIREKDLWSRDYAPRRVASSIGRATDS
ncbi:MAG: hypothetical protein OEW91_13460 [Acidimicrobiia bacterium]|nr:hypothetical protein [Acidimicrobiia bacterium]